MGPAAHAFRFTATLLLSVLAILRCALLAAAKNPEQIEKNHIGISDLWIDDGAGFFIGEKAIYERGSDLWHWRAIDSLVGRDYYAIAGGDHEHLFLLSWIGPNGDSQQLVKWTRATERITPLAVIPYGFACAFTSGQRGAYGERSSPGSERSFLDLHLTIDGGEHRIVHKDLLGKKTEFFSLLWLSPQRLIVSGEKFVSCFSVNEVGELKQEWSQKIESGPSGVYLGRKDELWIQTGDRITSCDPATGKMLATIELKIPFKALAIIGDDLWVAGDFNAAVYRIGADGKWELIRQFGYPGESGGSTFNNGIETKMPPGGWVKWIASDVDGRAMLIGADGQVYQWDGKADVLTARPLLLDSTAADKAQRRAEENESPPAQDRELLSLLGKVFPNQLGDVEEASKARAAAEHWNERQRVAWTIEQLKKLAAQNESSTKPASRPANANFQSLMGVRLFSPTSGIAVTMEGVVVTDGSLLKWKGVTGWDRRHDYAWLAGASEDELYVLSGDFPEVVVKEGFDPPPGMERDPAVHRIEKHGRKMLTRNDGVFILWRWTAASGFSIIRDIPRSEADRGYPAPCAFASDRVGAYVDGRTLRITMDGALSWVETPLALEKNERGISQIVFCGTDKLAIVRGGDSISLLAIDQDGHAHEQWRKSAPQRLEGNSRLAYDAVGGRLWLCASLNGGKDPPMLAYGLNDGKIVSRFAAFDEGEYCFSYSIGAGKMALKIRKDAIDLLRIWDISGETPKRLGDIQSEDGSHSPDIAYFVPRSPDVYVELESSRLMLWDGTSTIPTFLPSRIHMASVDLTTLDAAEDRRPPGTDPSRRESDALSLAQHQLTQKQQAQLLEEIAPRVGQFANYRAQVLWMTKRALELKSEPSTNAAAPSSAAR